MGLIPEPVPFGPKAPRDFLCPMCWKRGGLAEANIRHTLLGYPAVRMTCQVIEWEEVSKREEKLGNRGQKRKLMTILNGSLNVADFCTIASY